MEIEQIIELTDAKVICGEIKNEKVDSAFSSDLMSDVLTIDSENLLLITGTANLQAIRTAEMADISFILFCRDKKATKEMIELACENELILLETSYSLYRTSGILYQAGLKPVY